MTNNNFESLENRRMLSVTPIIPHPSGTTGGTGITVPATPTGLTEKVSGTTVKLSWSETSTSQTSFIIQRAAGSNAGLVTIGTVSGTTTTFTDTKALAGTDVYVVRAVDAAGTSEGSNSVSATIPAPIVTVIAAGKLTASAVSASKIAISWSGDAGATGGYTIQRSPDGKTAWTTAGTTPAGVRTFTDSGLSAGTTYFYRIVAVSLGGQTAVSAVIQGKTSVGGTSK